MRQVPHLNQFPALASWYLQNSATDTQHDQQVQFKKNICETLTQDQTYIVKKWFLHLQAYFEVSTKPKDAYDWVIDTFNKYGMDFMELTATIAELAIKQGNAEITRQKINAIADYSNVAPIQFLAAWFDLNIGDLNSCIARCDEIENELACVATLQGQAFLELGEAENAVEALRTAVQLDPNDPLPYFQLAKAYYAIDDHIAAIEQLRKCETLLPRDPEVIFFLALNYIKQAKSDERDAELHRLYPELLAAFSQQNDWGELCLLLFNIAFLLHEKSLVQEIFELAQWHEIKNDPAFFRSIAEILRCCDENGWKDHSNRLVTALSTVMNQAN